jgi:hypothetical protein
MPVSELNFFPRLPRATRSLGLSRKFEAMTVAGRSLGAAKTLQQTHRFDPAAALVSRRPAV